MAVGDKCAAANCRKTVPEGQRKYCSDGCRNRQNARNHRKRVAKPKEVGTGQNMNRGQAYRLLATHGLVDDVLSGAISIREAAQRIEQPPASVRFAANSHRVDRDLAEAASEWHPDPDVRDMLMWDDNNQPIPAPPEGPKLEKFLVQAVEAFILWRTTFMGESRPGVPWYTEAFHRVWMIQILRAIVTGGKQLILSPPRHGKSELLVHFCVWLICRQPNIRILWVAGSGEIAELMIGAVKQHLDGNDALRIACLPPGATWAPSKRTGSNWSANEFRVDNRTIVSPSPTMTAIGRNAKVLSRTTDFIIADDLEDHQSTDQPHLRGGTRRWFTTQLDSRHEEHTGWVTIGSRQHADDIYGHLLDDPTWSVIVERAHSSDCTKPVDQPKLHKTCMLFPRVRSYKWLMDKKSTAAAVGEEGLYEMVYLNEPRSEGAMIFVGEDIDACMNPRLGIGVPKLSTTTDPEVRYPTLVAGLDPAATGYQAAFLWGWDRQDDMLYVCDIDNRRGGGITAAFELFRDWHARYGLRHWVIEENNFQRAIRQDPRIKLWAAQNQIHLEGHETYANKADPHFGVGAMNGLYIARKIVIPYGTAEAKEKAKLLRRQLVAFGDDDGPRRNRNKSDVLMSSWFPMKVIRRWKKEVQADLDMEYTPSYPGFDISDMNSAPWR